MYPTPNVSAPALEKYLRRINYIGVAYPGKLWWDCFPQGAASASVTTGTADNTDAAAVTLISNGGIPVVPGYPISYYLTHVAYTCPTPPGSTNRIRIKLRTPTAGTVRRFILDTPPAPSDTARDRVHALWPYPVPGGDGVDMLVAKNTGSATARTFRVYLTVVRSEFPPPNPQYMLPAAQSVGGTLPDDTEMEGITSHASVAWQFGDYATLTNGLDDPVLITAVNLGRGDPDSSGNGNNEDAQISFATSAPNGSFQDWGIFGLPTVGSNIQGAVAYELMPFGFYLPAGMRLAARVRASATGLSFNAGVEYVTLPLH